MRIRTCPWISGHAALFVLLCAGAVAIVLMAPAAWAHQDPFFCCKADLTEICTMDPCTGDGDCAGDEVCVGGTGNGIGVSIVAFRDAGGMQTIGAGETVLECETIYFQCSLNYQDSTFNGVVNSAFEQGDWQMMAGAANEMTDLGDVPCVGGQTNDPNSLANDGRGLCEGAPGFINSALVPYTVTPADVINGLLQARCIYGSPFPTSPDTTYSHDSLADTGGQAGQITLNRLIETCPVVPETDCTFAGICDPVDERCEVPLRDDSTPCTDTDLDCWDAGCEAGICVQEHLPVTASTPCDEVSGTECTDPGCDGTGVCDPLHLPRPDSTLCSDTGLDCWDPGCESGLCVQAHLPVAASTPCDEADGTECSDPGCDGQGTCDPLHLPRPDSTPCSDSGLDCWDPGCEGGLCVQEHVPVAASTPCDDADGTECSDPGCDGAGACDPAHLPKPDSTPCTDQGNECYDAGCESGRCVQEHIPEPCDDGNVCTDDSCDPATGCIFDCQPADKPECRLTLGDFIWNDDNADGLQTGEAGQGIGNVKLNLIDCTDGGATVIDMVNTEADGFYDFTVLVDETCNLEPRKFQVEVDDSNFDPGGPLEGLGGSPKNVGTDDSIDSDCDAGLTDCTTHPYGTGDPTIDCGYFGACELDVTKTCCIVTPPPPTTGTDCQGKITSLRLEYTGDGCDVMTNPQEGKASCSGMNEGLEPVDILVSDNRGDRVYADETGVFIDDVIHALASNAGENDFESETVVTIDDGTQVIKFHTSCSKPIKVGDQWGSIRVVELTSTEGGTVVLEDPDPDASACLPPSAPPPPHCQGKVVQAVFEYTAGNCADSENTQGSKFSCSGVLDGDEPVDIVVTEDVTAVMVVPYRHIFVGELVTFTATGNELKSSLEFSILRAGANRDDELPDDVLQELDIHTSCSAPLNVGDVFGGMRLVELTTTEGGTVGLPDPDPPEPTSDCVVPPPEPFPCDNKIGVLGLRYQGGDCSETTNPQEGAVNCTDYDFVAPLEPVRIRVFKDSEIFLETGNPASVSLGEWVNATAAAGGLTKFPSTTFVEIFDEDGNLLQALDFHTSCSKTINIGDRFGALEIAGLTDEDGNAYLPGAEIEYTYTITNPGVTPVTDVVVVDDKLGPITDDPIPSIDPDETVILREIAVISEDTVNTATVAYSQGTQVCADEEASASVTVLEDPDDEDDDSVNCTTKVQAMLLEYSGRSLPGPVTVLVEADKFRNEPAVYEFPRGLEPGTMLALPSENDMTIDALVHGENELGSKTTLYINGVAETIHTSCSTPFRAGYPAPLNEPKGQPSNKWFVVSFRQKP